MTRPPGGPDPGDARRNGAAADPARRDPEMDGPGDVRGKGDGASGEADVPRKFSPLFLHRDTYRRRRVMDAARLLPLFGGALLMLPLLWADGHSTANGAVYVFTAWLGLILAAVYLSRKLSEPLRERDRSGLTSAGDGPGAAPSPPGRRTGE